MPKELKKLKVTYDGKDIFDGYVSELNWKHEREVYYIPDENRIKLTSPSNISTFSLEAKAVIPIKGEKYWEDIGRT